VCKREKQVGPSKARAAAEAALTDEADPPHGFVLAVPCDLSRQTRDALASQLRGAGVREIHTWGRAELEDLLFLPENDHLLFAYFGVSLQVRRHNRTSELRSRLAKKLGGAICSADTRAEEPSGQGRGRSGANSSQTSFAWITPRT
jgi:hypothetical protein